MVYLESEMQAEMHKYFLTAAGEDVFKQWLRVKWNMAYSAQNYGDWS